MKKIGFLLFVYSYFCKIYTLEYNKKNGFPFFLDFEVCRTNICYKDANEILSSLNRSIDPCSNFYNFVCGGWISKNKKPLTEASWSRWEPVMIKIEKDIQNDLENQSSTNVRSLQIARNMYHACINFEMTELQNIKELLKLINSYDGWPIIDSKWSSKMFWLNTVAKINSELNVHPLINFHTSINLYNTSEYILYVDYPIFSYPTGVLLKPNVHKQQMRAYFKWIMKSVLEIAKIIQINIPFNNTKRQVLEIIEFEIKIASLTQNKSNDENISNLYKKISVNQLQLWTDLISLKGNKTINWSNILEILLHNTREIDNEKHIIVKDFMYLLKLIQLIENTPPHIIANYLGWSIVKYFSQETTRILQKFSFDNEKVLHGVEENLSRESACVMKLKKQMDLIVSHEYIKRHVNEEAKKEIELMLESMKSALISKINLLKWMDDETKKEALKKINSISYLVAYPEYYKNITFIDQYYQELKTGNNNIENIINWNQFKKKKEFQVLNKKTETSKWYNSVIDVNAYYSVLQNSVIIPSGLLQYPFYEVNRLSALNYGAIGTLVAHELSHAFDNTGRQADKNGNIKQWWSARSLASYKKNVECIEKHFQITFKQNGESDPPINKQQTQDENIADIIGLEIAYHAYQQIKYKQVEFKLPKLKSFTRDQLFFISFASQWCESSTPLYLQSQITDGDHTPNKFRVLGVLSNSREFNKAFQCRKDSLMNTNEKCRL